MRYAVAVILLCSATNGFIVPTQIQCRPSTTTTLLSSTSIVVNNNNNDEEPVVVEQSRRALLFSAAAAALTVGVTATPQTDYSSTLLSVDEAIAWIDQNCDRRFLNAVVASDYRFMYRGVNNDEQKKNFALVLKEESDLLIPGTYTDNKAVNYFENLEQILKDDVVKPSNGHLATTSVREASNWGTPASIWPLSDNAHYAWIQQGGVFYPPSSTLTLDRNQLIIDGKDCGRDSLEDALRGESWEIMFRADSYLAVPVPMEQALRRGLKNSFIV
jgi:hypothetical protein